MQIRAQLLTTGYREVLIVIIIFTMVDASARTRKQTLSWMMGQLIRCEINIWGLSVYCGFTSNLFVYQAMNRILGYPDSAMVTNIGFFYASSCDYHSGRCMQVMTV